MAKFQARSFTNYRLKNMFVYF